MKGRNFYYFKFIIMCCSSFDINIFIIKCKTPNGSDVEVIERQEGSKEKIEEINKKYDSMYSKAERISSASYIYNCHSFVWYS